MSNAWKKDEKKKQGKNEKMNSSTKEQWDLLKK